MMGSCERGGAFRQIPDIVFYELWCGVTVKRITLFSKIRSRVGRRSNRLLEFRFFWLD